MRPPRLSVVPLRLPDFLEKKCQALLDDIQGAHSVNVALLTEQYAAGFTEALAWPHAPCCYACRIPVE